MTSTIFANKDALRKEMRARLSAMTAGGVSRRSSLLLERLREGGWLPPGSTVTLFGGIQGEPDLLELVPWLLERGSVPVFFGFSEGMLVPQRVDDAGLLHRGVFGVWVPPPEAEVVPYEDLDVILTPGLAFSGSGVRLGRGKGHYDRLFGRSEVKARRIGLCWDFQLVDTVPMEPHDALMNAVISDA